MREQYCVSLFHPARCLVILLSILGATSAGRARETNEGPLSQEPRPATERPNAAVPPADNMGDQWVTFRDNYLEDTRRDYTIRGNASWEKGLLKIGPKAALVLHEVKKGPFVGQIRLTIDFPSLEVEGESSESALGFICRRGFVGFYLRRVMKEGRELLTIVTRANKDKLREFPQKTGALGGEWAFSIRHGLFEIGHGEDSLAIGYVGNPGSIIAVVLGQNTGSYFGCRRLMFAGTDFERRIDAEDKKAIDEADRMAGTLPGLWRTGDHNKAEEVTLRVLATYLEVYGPNRTELLTATRRVLGYAASGDMLGVRLAEELYDSLIKDAEAAPTLGERHPLTMALKSDLGQVLQRSGKPSESWLQYITVLSSTRAVFGDESDEVEHALRRVVQSLVAMSPATPSVVQKPLTLVEQFREDFTTANRSKFETKGDLEWRNGTLTLHNGLIARKIDSDPIAELTMTLDFPPLGKDGDESVSQIGFRDDKGASLLVVVQRQRNEGREQARLVMLAGGSRAQPPRIRSLDLGTMNLSGSWRVRYRFGLLAVEREGTMLCLLDSQELPKSLSAVELGQSSGELRCSSLSCFAKPASVPLAPGVREMLEQTKTIYGEAQQMRIKGQDQQAVDLMRRVTDVLLSNLGPEHPETILCQQNLAAMLLKTGQYEAATVQLKRALEASRTVNGEVHPATAACLLSLGNAAGRLSDFIPAVQYTREAFRLALQIYGERSYYTATAISQLGSLLKESGDATAWRYLATGLSISELTFGKDNLHTANMRTNMGNVTINFGGEAALADLEQAYRIQREALGDANPSTAHARFSLGFALAQKGKLTEGWSHCYAAYEVWTRTYGEEHPITAHILTQLGAIRQLQGSWQEALGFHQRAARVRLKLAEDLLPALPDATAFAYIKSVREDIGPLLALTPHCPDTQVDSVYELVWHMRSLASRALQLRRDLSLTDPAARQKAEELRRVRTELAQVSLSTPPPERATARKARLLELSQRKEQLQQELAEVSPEFRSRLRLQSTRFADLASRLPARTVVIDLLETVEGKKSASGERILDLTRSYHAFILRGDTRPPGYRLDWVSLGSAQEIDGHVRQWRLLNGGRGQPENRDDVSGHDKPGDATLAQTGAALRRLTWSRWESHIGPGDTVIIIPDGMLTGAPWPALPGKNKDTLLIEDHAIATAPFGQQILATLGRQAPEGKEVLLVGGVAYEKRPGRAGQPRLLPPQHPASVGPRDRAGWGDLPGTLKEVDEIEVVCNRYFPQLRVTLLQATNASESAVIEWLPRSRYAHFATHGFFSDLGTLPGGMPTPIRTEADRMPMDEGSIVLGRNPLLLSGVVLAGAALPPDFDENDAPRGLDGILTAEEVVGLDLDGTELVTLSACETGLGEVADGEGVLGLQRAFGAAGVRTVVASLWKVPDDATQELMTRFYENLGEKKMPKLEALRQAQLSMLRREVAGRPIGKGLVLRPSGGARRAPPWVWAAWTLSGDWW